jgi:NADH-quinone oxidoreductase subunit M
VVAGVGVILSAVYMLWMFQRVMFGKIVHDANRTLRDLTGREWAVLLPVILFIIWLGVYPQPFLRTMDASIARTLQVYGVQQEMGMRAPDGAAPAETPEAAR